MNYTCEHCPTLQWPSFDDMMVHNREVHKIYLDFKSEREKFLELVAERDRLLLQVDELKAQVEKCRCCGDPLVCPKRFEDMNRLIRAAEPVIGAARLMVKHQQDRHELSSCCHDVTPTNAYLLERALKEWDATQNPTTDLKRNCEVSCQLLGACGSVPCGEPLPCRLHG